MILGKLSRLRMLGHSYLERLDVKKGAKILGDRYREHVLSGYPKTEVDSEGTMIWDSPKKCNMRFNGLTPEEGYIKTVDKFKRFHVNKLVRIYINGEFVVVEWG